MRHRDVIIIYDGKRFDDEGVKVCSYLERVQGKCKTNHRRSQESTDGAKTLLWNIYWMFWASLNHSILEFDETLLLKLAAFWRQSRTWCVSRATEMELAEGG